MECKTEDELLKIFQLSKLEEFEGLYTKKDSILKGKNISELEETALHLASRFKEMALVKVILKDKDGKQMAKARNGEGDTPLHVACRQGEKDIVQELLKACSFLPYILNKDKQSALFLACSCGHEDLASLLCERMIFSGRDGISASCLRIASSKGYQDIVKKILEENPSSASRKDDYGISAMHLASREGKVEVIKTLIEKDSNLSFLKDNYERTPLHWAVMTNQLSVVEALLSSTSLNTVQVADLINGADKDGNAVLHLAAINDYLEVIKRLLTKRPIKVNDANNDGMTALDILEKNQAGEAEKVDSKRAAIRERSEIIKQLKDRKGPDPISQTTMQEKSLNNMQQALMVVAALIVTLTFQAGLNPPGGLWQDSEGGNQTNHKPGKAIQSETNPWLFTIFLASNALGFISSLALIPLIMTLRTNMLPYVNSLAVTALLSVEVAFIFGLIMISDRMPFYRVEIFLLIFLTLAGIVWATWKCAQLK